MMTICQYQFHCVDYFNRSSLTFFFIWKWCLVAA